MCYDGQGGKRLKRSRSRKIAVIAIIAAAFALYIAFTNNKASSEKQPFSIAQYHHAVKTFQSKHTPGLTRAEKLGLTRSYRREVKIPGTHITLRIEELWYSRGRVYLFYSIGPILKKEAGNSKKGMEPFPYLTAGMTNPMVQGQPNSSMRARGPGILYDGRLYQSIRFSSPLRDGKGNMFPTVNQLVLNQIQYHENGQKHQIADIKLPLHYTVKQEKTKTFPIGQTDQIGKYTLTFDRFILGTAENRLIFHFRYDNPVEDLLGLKMAVMANGNKKSLWGIERNKDRLVYAADPFDHYPKKVRIHVKAVRMLAHGSFYHFVMDLNQLQKTEHPVKVNRKIGKIKNTKIFLNKVEYNDKGLWMQIRYQEPENQKVHLVAATPHFSYQNWRKDAHLSTVIEAVNKDHKYAYGGQTGSGPGPLLGFRLNSNFLKGSDTIGITIQNLPFEMDVNRTFTIHTMKK